MLDPYESGSVKRDTTSFDEGPDTGVRILCLNLQLYPLLKDWKEKLYHVSVPYLSDEKNNSIIYISGGVCVCVLYMWYMYIFYRKFRIADFTWKVP